MKTSGTLESDHLPCKNKLVFTANPNFLSPLTSSEGIPEAEQNDVQLP